MLSSSRRRQIDTAKTFVGKTIWGLVLNGGVTCFCLYYLTVEICAPDGELLLMAFYGAFTGYFFFRFVLSWIDHCLGIKRLNLLHRWGDDNDDGNEEG